jgi:hypothetical protein
MPPSHEDRGRRRSPCERFGGYGASTTETLAVRLGGESLVYRRCGDTVILLDHRGTDRSTRTTRDEAAEMPRYALFYLELFALSRLDGLGFSGASYMAPALRPTFGAISWS